MPNWMEKVTYWTKSHQSQNFIAQELIIDDNLKLSYISGIDVVDAVSKESSCLKLHSSGEEAIPRNQNLRSSIDRCFFPLDQDPGRV